MPSAFLFACYFILLSLALNWLVRRKYAGINTRMTIFIFSFKVLLGCLYGYIFLKYFGGDDTWMYHHDSITEYQKLVHHPDIFFKDFLPAASFVPAHDFCEGLGLYIQDLEYWLMIKLLAVFNIFSRGNYYINVLFFDFLTCWGPLLLYQLMYSY